MTSNSGIISKKTSVPVPRCLLVFVIPFLICASILIVKCNCVNQETEAPPIERILNQTEYFKDTDIHYEIIRVKYSIIGETLMYYTTFQIKMFGDYGQGHCHLFSHGRIYCFIMLWEDYRYNGSSYYITSIGIVEDMQSFMNEVNSE